MSRGFGSQQRSVLLHLSEVLITSHGVARWIDVVPALAAKDGRRRITRAFSSAVRRAVRSLEERGYLEVAYVADGVRYVVKAAEGAPDPAEAWTVRRRVLVRFGRAWVSSAARDELRGSDVEEIFRGFSQELALGRQRLIEYEEGVASGRLVPSTEVRAWVLNGSEEARSSLNAIEYYRRELNRLPLLGHEFAWEWTFASYLSENGGVVHPTEPAEDADF